MGNRLTPPPWKHQAEDLEASWDRPAAMLDWDPRTGKTRIAIETADRLRAAGLIDAALVVAPNGVHLNWTRAELPKYWPEDVPTTTFEWDSDRSSTVGFQRDLEKLSASPNFVWLAVNIEAVGNQRGKRLLVRLKKGSPGWLERFVKTRRVLLLVDESHWAKDPKALRTRALDKLARECPYRRTLTGTVMANSPFDLWAQYHLLSPMILGPLFTTFKARYGQYRWNQPRTCSKCGTNAEHPTKFRGRIRVIACVGCGHEGKANPMGFDDLLGYRRLDELAAEIAPFTFSRRKADCMDLPDRTFTRRYFLMPPEHRQLYDEVREDLIARLDSGETVTALSALTNLLRLQQISRGFVKPDEGDGRAIGGPSPAIEATVELLREHRGKSIVWCHFRSDVDLLAEVFDAEGITYIRCDGSTPAENRPGLRDLFNDPDSSPQVWLGTLATGGTGVDLGGASLMIFYSHGYSLTNRLQGLERNYGSTQKAQRVDVVDIVAANTSDERCLDALARKEDLAAQLTGRALRELLR